MIPKTIHYCWFGGKPKPKLAKKCIESWKKHCPDYEIIEWNETNFDVNQDVYTKVCFEQGKWAFLSDYVRLKVISENGGIYFDTDVEVLKSIDDLLEFDAFYGFENNDNINTGQGFGSAAHHPIVEAMLQQYEGLADENGNVKTVGCPTLNTQAALLFGLQLNGKKQELSGAIILPAEYTNPYNDATGRLNTTQNTYSIHWYSKSALSKKQILRSKLTRPLHRAFGEDVLSFLRK